MSYIPPPVSDKHAEAEKKVDYSPPLFRKTLAIELATEIVETQRGPIAYIEGKQLGAPNVSRRKQ